MRLGALSSVGISGAIIIGSMSSATAGTVFQDSFSGFSLGTNWTAESYGGALGPPNVLLSLSAAGLRMVSAQSDNQTRGLVTATSFSVPSGTIEVDFRTGAASDGGLNLPPGTTSSNIDGLLGIRLFNPATGAFLQVGLFGGFYGSDRYFYTASSSDPEVDSSSKFGPGPTDWNYDESYRIVLSSLGASTDVSFEDGSGDVLFSDTIVEGFGDLSTFDLALEQHMGIPGSPYYSDVTLESVEVSSTDVSEPGTLASFLSGAVATLFQLRAASWLAHSRACARAPFSRHQHG